MLFVLETKQMPGSQRLGDTEREGVEDRGKGKDEQGVVETGRPRGLVGGSNRCRQEQRQRGRGDRWRRGMKEKS